jgi:hypothetical protein
MSKQNRMEDYVHKADAPYSFVIEITWLGGMGSFTHGWGNGYVAIPKGHPLYEVDYDNIENIEINGGLIFGEMVNEMWVIGFDTAHYGDTITRWPESAVKEHADYLLEQVLAVTA